MQSTLTRFIHTLGPVGRSIFRARAQILVIAGTGVLVLVLTWLPYLIARHIARSQNVLVKAALEQASATAAVMGADNGMSRVQLGEIGPFKQYALRLTERSQSFKAVSPRPPAFIWPPFLPSGLFPARYVHQVNITGGTSSTTELATTASLRQAAAIMNHDAKVQTALVNILSYNPRTDFATFDPKSGDTKKRLDLAATGLSKTKQSLEKLTSKADPTLPKLIDAISQLQAGRDKLARGGSVDDWVAVVGLIQVTIINNRTAYWQAQGAPLARQLETATTELQNLSPAWTTLAAGRL